MNKYQVSVAAEAYAAATFARAGYEVSVQYGANQPGYDLVAVKGKRILKVSVKGSQDGGWALLAGYKRGRTWPQAVAAWRAAQPRDVVMFFVQFQDVPEAQTPRMHVARPREVAAFLMTGRNGHVATCLHETRFYKKGVARGNTDLIPPAWSCSKKRMNTV
jgi:Holliday junction resolvase-like predicted endonuclease